MESGWSVRCARRRTAYRHLTHFLIGLNYGV
jgi:hypothetical protein